MALSPVASILPGCSQLCAQSVKGIPTGFAYCSNTSILLYKLENKNVPLPSAKDAAGTPAASQVVTTPNYSLQSVFSCPGLSAFDFNEDNMVCFSSLSKAVQMWKITGSETAVIRKPLELLTAAFKQEGDPSAVAFAGKYHIIFGTRTGKLISLNTNEGHEPRTVTLPSAPRTAQSGATPSVSDMAGQSVEAVPVLSTEVHCVAVSSVRADQVASGTAEGTLCLLSLSPSTGLRVNATLQPFHPSVRDRKKLTSGTAVLGSGPLPVSVLAFDPINPQYLAVGSVEGALALCDVQSNSIVQTFEYTATHVSSIAWIPGQSGQFYTVSKDRGRVERWSLNNKTPTAAFAPVAVNIGIRAISCIDGERVVVTLVTGAVVVYNVASQSTEFSTPQGHTEAIFGCSFAKHDCDLVASCSMDGTISVWNTKLMSFQYKMTVGPVIVYSVDWSHNGKYIIAGLGNGEVAAYATSTKKETWRESVFCDAVYRVIVSVADHNHIAVASRQGLAIVSAKDGKVLRRYCTRSALYSCDFEPSRGQMIAAGCQDHRIYVYGISSSADTPMLVLSGHGDFVCDVKFNPCVPNYLLSCSQDSMVRLWDLSSNDSHTISVSARVLRGHSDRVRCVAWCSLAPYLALSGCNDATIRVWDIRNGMTVTTVRAHSADVCALTTHPDRPLVFASAGKDGALMFWHLTLLRQVYLEAVLGSLESCVAADASSLLAVSSNVSVSVVAGQPVRTLVQALRECTTAAQRMERLVSFFEFPCGSADLVKLAHYAVDPSTYTADAKTIVVPYAKLVEARRARAKYVTDKAHGKSVAAAGQECRKARLVEAADELLRVGNFEECCNLLIEAEEYDRAVAIAPLISRGFWRDMCRRAGEATESRGDDRAAAYFIMAEDSARAARVVSRQSCTDHDAAAVVGLTCPQYQPQSHDPSATAEPPHHTTVDSNGVSAVSRELQQLRIASLVSYDNPRLLASAQLACGCNDEAVRFLAYAGDVCLTHLLVHTVPLREQASIDAAYRLSMLQCSRQHQWESALMCASRQSNPYDGLANVLAVFQQTQCKYLLKAASASNGASMGSLPTMSNEKLRVFHEQVLQECRKLNLPLDAAAIQQRHASDGLASQNQLAAMALSPGTVLGPSTSSEVLQSTIGFMESLLSVVLQDADGPNAGFYLKQAYNVSAYITIPMSLSPNTPTINSGTDPSISPHLTSIGTSSSMSPEHYRFLSLVYILAMLMMVKVYRFPAFLNPAFAKATELGKGHHTVETLLAKVQGVIGTYSPHSVEVFSGPIGAGIPVLAVDGKQLMSSLTGLPLRGSIHLLEDGNSFISRQEALSWMLCCHFSPLASGARLNAL